MFVCNQNYITTDIFWWYTLFSKWLLNNHYLTLISILFINNVSKQPILLMRLKTYNVLYI